MSAKRLKIWDWAPRDWEKYDICLTFPIEPTTYRLPPEAILVIKNLVKLLGRKYIYAFYSDDSSKIYLLVRTRLKLLRAKAHSEGWMLPLDEELCQVMAYAGNESDLIVSFAVPHRPEITPLPPFKHLYARYVNDEAVDHLYRRKHNMRHPFHKSLRIKMLTDFLQRSPLPDHDLALDHLVESKVALDCVGVHDVREKNELAADWLDIFPTFFPLERVRDYFGEKVALYFAYIDYLYYWMLPISVVGVGFEIPALMFDTFSRPEIPTFSYIMVLYIIIFVQYWKYTQQIICTKWNTLGCEVSARLAEHKRYTYSGVQMVSYVDGKEMIYFHPYKRVGFYVLSFIVTMLFLSVSLIGVMALYFGRWNLYYTSTADYAQWITSGATAVQIMFANWLYYYIAEVLTRWENHRSDGDHEAAMVVKLFVFIVTNALSSFYYLAFAARYIKRHKQNSDSLGECGFHNCMQPLAINTCAIIGTLVLYRVCVHFLPSLLSYGMLTNCCGYYKEQGFNQSDVMQPILSLDPMLPGVDGEGEGEGEEDVEAGSAPARRSDGGLHISTDPNDFDEEEMAGRQEGRTLRGYLKRQQSSVFVKERAQVDDFVGENPEHAGGRNQGIPLSPTNSTPGRPAYNRVATRSSADGGLASESFYEMGNDPPASPSSSPGGSMRRSPSRITSTQRAQRKQAANFDRESIDIKVDDDEEEGAGDRVPNPFAAPRGALNTSSHLLRQYSHLLTILSIAFCFGSTLPAVYLAVAFYLYIEMRGQAWQLLYLYPRCLPEVAESIGYWVQAIDLTVVLAIPTNACLIILTMKQFEEWSMTHRLMLWIGIVSSLGFVQYLLSHWFSKLPEETIIQRQRSRFIGSKLIERLPDKEDTLAIDML